MRAGFSLVELSIVLVILGLLTGGILSGQSLIRAAEVRGVSSDYQRFTAAVYTFRDKYFAMPGDMPNATTFWGVAGGNGEDADCHETVSTGTETCNGDGDGQIKGPASPFNERYRFWQHLANAALIEGQYTGTLATESGYADIYVGGVNVPVSRLGGSNYWHATYKNASTGSASTFAFSAANQLMSSPAGLTPQECWNLDMKMDDGRPGTGKQIAFKGDATYPVTTAAGILPPGDADAEYNFAETSKVCNPIFSLGQ